MARRPRKRLSPYDKGRLSIALWLGIGALWLVVGVLEAARYSGFLLVSMAFFAALMVALYLWARCPGCRTSVFERRFGPISYSGVWPHRTCAGCGKSLAGEGD